MIFPIVIAFSFHLPAPARDEDRWLAPDKVKHFFSAAFVQSVSYGTLRALRAGNGSALLGASAVTATVSIGKEVWDANGHGTPSVRDVVWDAAGAGAISVLLSHTVR
jgi:uncharacterized protein YfiM (DUF2279 family)